MRTIPTPVLAGSFALTGLIVWIWSGNEPIDPRTGRQGPRSKTFANKSDY